MKILVPTKRVPDTDQRIKVRADGLGIEEEMLPYVINPFDAIALEEALRIAENQGDVEIVAVGIGNEEYEKQMRTALAMGAERAMIVKCDDVLDPWNVAQVLGAVVEREQPNLVLMGKQAVDDDANQAGQFLAALLGWPQATFASQITFEGEVATVRRETDAGIETVKVGLPAVITTDLRLNEPRYASLPSIMKAKKKPIEEVAIADLGVTLEPKVELLGLEAAETTRSCKRVGSVAELVTALRDEAKVI